MSERPKKLQALLDEKNSDGSRRYPIEDFRDCLALLVLGSKDISASSLPAPLQELLGGFALKIGFVGRDATPDKLQPALDRYFRDRAPDVVLLEAMKAALR